MKSMNFPILISKYTILVFLITVLLVSGCINDTGNLSPSSAKDNQNKTSDHPTQLTSNDIEEKEPIMSGSNIVFYTNEQFSNDVSFYLLNKDSKKLTFLANGNAIWSVVPFDFDSGKLVWAKSENYNVAGFDSLYVLDVEKINSPQGTMFSTDVKVKLNITSSTKVAPQIYGNYVVWHDGRDAGIYHVYLYDLVTNTEKRISDSPSKQVMPSIWNDYIAWEDSRERTASDPQIGGNIYYKKFDQGQEQQATSSFSSLNPKVAGSYIFYGDYRDNCDGHQTDCIEKYDIFIYDINNKRETKIFKNSGSSANDVYLRASDKYAGWKISDSSGNVKIYLYNMAAGKTFQLKEDGIVDFDIDGNAIVFSKKVDGKTELFYSKISYYEQ